MLRFLAAALLGAATLAGPVAAQQAFTLEQVLSVEDPEKQPEADEIEIVA